MHGGVEVVVLGMVVDDGRLWMRLPGGFHRSRDEFPGNHRNPGRISCCRQLTTTSFHLINPTSPLPPLNWARIASSCLRPEVLFVVRLSTTFTNAFDRQNELYFAERALDAHSSQGKC